MSDGIVDKRNGATDDDSARLALDRLHAGWDPLADAALDSEVRQYLEVLVLLGDDVDDVEPSPAVESALMAKIAATPQASVTGRVVPFARPDEPQRSSTWLVPALAAGLALCLVGMGYLYGQLTTLQGQLAVQSAQVAEAETVQLRLIETQQEVADLHERLAMVDVIAQSAYPLRPVSLDEMSQKKAEMSQLPNGRVYVCGQHQRWYLTAQHLDPAPPGQEYHLWYMTDEGAIDAGIVEVGAGGSALLRNLSMPEGTHGFAITLEDVGMDDGEPHGPTILHGDEPVRL